MSFLIPLNALGATVTLKVLNPADVTASDVYFVLPVTLSLVIISKLKSPVKVSPDVKPFVVADNVIESALISVTGIVYGDTTGYTKAVYLLLASSKPPPLPYGSLYT